MTIGYHSRNHILIAIYVIAFAVATAFHASDLITWGWLPYRFAPLSLNAFWTALLFLDLTVLALFLSGRLRSALLLTASIMVTDVAANSYALFGLGYPEFAVSLQLQTGFLGFVIGSAPFLWSMAEAPGLD